MKTNGPGKYDNLATVAREMTQAEAIFLFIIGGSKGSGFEVQTTDPTILPELPRMLREVADQLEKDIKT